MKAEIKKYELDEKGEIERVKDKDAIQKDFIDVITKDCPELAVLITGQHVAIEGDPGKYTFPMKIISRVSPQRRLNAINVLMLALTSLMLCLGDAESDKINHFIQSLSELLAKVRQLQAKKKKLWTPRR